MKSNVSRLSCIVLASLALTAGCYGGDAPVGPGGTADGGAEGPAESVDGGAPESEDLATVQCASPDYTDIRHALGALSERWGTFSANAEAQGTHLGACINNRVKSNGRVVCAAASAGSCASGAAGYSLCLSRNANICPGWLSSLHGRYPAGSAQRRICLGVMAAHEFTHSCCETENSAERVEAAAFATLRAYYDLPSFNLADCLTK